MIQFQKTKPVYCENKLTDMLNDIGPCVLKVFTGQQTPGSTFAAPV